MQAHEAISEGLLVLSAVVLSVMLPHRELVRQKTAAVTMVKSRSAAAAPVAVPKQVPVHPAAPVTKIHAAHPPVPTVVHTRLIVVSLEDRRLALVEDGQVKEAYTVAVGKDSTPSPTGTFTIVERVSNPTYYHDGKVIPPGPGNPVGDRWMGLSKPGYGIHGTNAPKSIGKAASHGCIRMSRRDLENLFAQVRAGDTVEIIGARNQETAAVFGAPATPAATVPAQMTLAEAATQTSAQAQATPTGLAAATAVAAPGAMALGQ